MDTRQLPKPIISRIPHPYNRPKAKTDALATANSVGPSANTIGKSGGKVVSSKGRSKKQDKIGCDVDSEDEPLDAELFKLPAACIPLGNADSTTEGWQSACNHWNKVAKKVGNPKWEEIQGRNLTLDLLMMYFKRHFKYCADYPMPKNSDDNLMPIKKDSKACMHGKTFVQYGGRVMRVWCERMPVLKDTVLKDFKGNDVPRWWVDLCADALSRWKRNYENNWKNNPNFEWGHQLAKPLSLHAIPPSFVDWSSQRELWYSHDVGEHHGRTGLAEWFVDLTRIVTTLLKRAFLQDNEPTHIHNAMRVVMQWHACGRSTEASQANYQRWRLDLPKQCVVPNWNSAKTLSDISSPFVMSLHFNICCFMLNFAIFITAGKGLHRTFEHAEKKVADFVFPDDWLVDSTTVQRRVTTSLRGACPGGTPDHVKACLTPKSLRQGGIDRMSSNSKLNMFNVLGKSGHASTGNNIASYLDPASFVRGIPGAHVLADNPRCDATVYWPDPCWLGLECKEGFDSLLDVVLEYVDVEPFKRAGNLFLAVVHCLCILIMWQPELEELLGRDFAGLRWLQNAAEMADLRSSDPDLNHPVAVIQDWGKRLRAEYEHVNSKARLADHNDLGKLVEQQMELSHKLTRTVASLSQDNIEQHRKSRETFSAVSVGLTKQLDNLKSTLLVENSQLEKRCRELEATVSHLEVEVCRIEESREEAEARAACI